MTIEQAKKILNCSKQSWYYYKKRGLIHIRWISTRFIKNWFINLPTTKWFNWSIRIIRRNNICIKKELKMTAIKHLLKNDC